MKPEKSFHMNTAEFRKHGKEVIDWIADYYEQIESFPVLSPAAPGEIRNNLAEKPPQKGEPFETLLKDLSRIILPGVTHWQSPNFFAYFPANASAPAILGDLLSSGLGVQGMLWTTSPACTELETHVLDWIADIKQLPEKFKSSGSGGGVIQDSASSAALCAVIAAREKITELKSNHTGLTDKLIAYTSTQGHSSIEKAVKIAGIGADNLRYIGTDETLAMRPDLLAKQIAEDNTRGFLPFFVAATVGTTSSNAIDPLPGIGKICRENNLWLHVDGAMSGNAAICEEFRPILNGIELADSYCFNPHKWLFTNFDCDCFYVADRKALIDSLSILPEYLRNKATESGSVIDYRDWQVPLGRRFRALKLWFVIRHYGIEGLQFHVRKHVEIARKFAGWVEAHPDFELAVKPPLNLVCFRHIAGDKFNEQLINRLNAGGKIFLTHTKIQEKFALRMSIGQTNTELKHVENAWRLIQETSENIVRKK